jgi:MFS transporter, DHA1 family, multidrug resistance protein
VVAALALLVTSVFSIGGLVGFLVPLWFLMAAAGLAFPNAPAIALNRHAENAGTASALLGAAQFVLGGLIAPLVGALSDGTAVPLAGVVVGTTGLALVLFATVRRALAAESYS